MQLRCNPNVKRRDPLLLGAQYHGSHELLCLDILQGRSGNDQGAFVGGRLTHVSL